MSMLGPACSTSASAPATATVRTSTCTMVSPTPTEVVLPPRDPGHPARPSIEAIKRACRLQHGTLFSLARGG